MFVSSPPSCSKSRSFRFAPTPCVGDLFLWLLVLVDATDSAGDTRPVMDGATESALALEGRADVGGRIDCFLPNVLGRMVDMVRNFVAKETELR